MSVVLGVLALVLFLLALLYLFLILPRIGGADMELLACHYAHRGLWGRNLPENSLPAFAYAVQRGYGIELDVQRTKDGVPVIFHDDSLKRLCGIDKRVTDLTLAEIKALRLANTEYGIPTLTEVLHLVCGKVPLMIELKGDRPDNTLCQRLTEYLDAYMGPFSIISFSPLILGWFKKYRPSYARGQLVTKVTRHTRRGSRAVNFLLSNLLLNWISRPDFISIKDTCRHRLGFLVATRCFRTVGFVWTVRSAKDARLLTKKKLYLVFERIFPTKGAKS